jgi:putative hydrolase of the HAD superfamily
MPSGLLLDYGGVLTTSVIDSFADFCRTEDIDAGVFRATVLGAAKTADDPFSRIEIGAITQEEFDIAVAAMLTDACGKTIAHAGLKDRMFASVQPERAMLDAVSAARAHGIRTALVSNSWGGRNYPVDDFPALFDAVVISGEIGMRKPNRDIYEHAAKSVSLPPEECVFVDDFRVNVEGARAAGMTAIHHREPAATIAELEALFGVALQG